MISGSGLRGRPWPELMPDGRAALVLPAAPDRPVFAGDGWADRTTGLGLAAGPRPGWSAVLDDYRLTLHRPGATVWFDGEVGADRHWRRRLRDHRTLLLVTGPFTGVFDFRPAAEAGRLFLLTVSARLAGDL
ncbi:hypothetical protein K353_05816 [Kitasatospora sp. SolWspMP-SS2h]|uniref:hypothetical protein n=1 Tax=Kitasatospora sp. SolWspMP-SS2h TaxID=1305729 RepID=UPI000DBAD443|nr:hypothetical protein [Kitasatospora sp. SolWspMP-SS2h]RAJ32818.1 hypothetical protein K353_05816 [Kitasatospora sp. SolWspMP-SS2h]